jgi:hypothetical protein
MAASIRTFAKSSIGATAVQLTSTQDVTSWMYIKASASNVWIIYIGNSTVTAWSADATDWFELSAWEGVFIETNNPSLIYAIYSTTGGRVSCQLIY